jgi:hypothetical protein
LDLAAAHSPGVDPTPAGIATQRRADIRLAGMPNIDAEVMEDPFMAIDAEMLL